MLLEAGFSKKEIVEQIERLYGVSERQIERDFKALKPT
jgi:predicted DNA-binding transcriptional regulator YafY